VTAARTPAPSRSWRVAAVLLLVGIACGEWALGQAFDSRHAFDFYNVLFDADANVRVWVFSSGWGDYSLVHPWGWLPSLPIRAYAMVSTALASAPSALPLRREAALVFLPACAALSSGLMLTIAWRAGLGPARAMLAAALFGCSFAQVLFGSMPEYPVLSGATVAMVLALLAWECAEGRPAPTWVWLLAVLVCAGVTATNAVPAVAAFVVSRRAARWPWRAVAVRVLGVCAVGGAVSVAGLVVGKLAYRPQPVDVTAVVARYSNTLTTFSVVGRFPVALSSSVLPRSPSVVGNPLARRSGGRDIGFSLEPHGWRDVMAPAVWIVLLVVGLGAWSALRARDAWSPVTVAALIVMAHNWLVHSFYGSELVLFAANWTPALGVLVIALLRPARGRWAPASTVALLAAALTIGSVTAIRVGYVLQQLGPLAHR